MKLFFAFPSFALVALTLGCSAAPRENDGSDSAELRQKRASASQGVSNNNNNSSSSSATDRDVTVYGAAHWSFTVGRIPDDSNLPPSEIQYTIASAQSEPVYTYHPRAVAGTTLRIGSGIDGIYKLGDPPPGWTGECYDSCLPHVQLAKFDRGFVGYKLAGQVHELELGGADRSVDIAIPANATGTIEYWFRYQDAYGRNFWDSRWGQNYVVDITPVPSATIRFGAQGDPVVDGTLVPGGGVRIAYDIARLTSYSLTAQTKATNVSRLEANLGFDSERDSTWASLIAPAKSGATPDLPRFFWNNWEYYKSQVVLAPVFRIPPNAHKLVMSVYGEAINVDVSPVTRPGIYDVKGGITTQSSQAPRGFEFAF